MSIRVW